MRKIALLLIVLAATVGVAAQEGQESNLPGAVGGATTLTEVPTLPVGRIGANDLIGLTVYDAPELTSPVRVSPEGNIRLPMVKEPIHVAGLYPQDIEKVIRTALIDDHVLVDPIVTVTIMEYESRPITITGAVRAPVTFQAVGTVTLLDAISRAGGLTDNAGSEILISSQAPGPDGKETTLTQRVPVQNLLDTVDPSENVELHGGDVVRVPEAGQVFVMGDVKRPGPYFITGSSQSSIMKALAFSGGLDQHAGHVAYIFRKEGGKAGRNEIRVPLKKIMDRKSPDLALDANDILYIPNAKGGRINTALLQALTAAGTAAAVALIYIYH